MRRSSPLILLAALLLGAVAITAAMRGFFVDWLWFGSLGFAAVFSTIWKAKATIFVVFAAVSLLFLLVNGLLAVRSEAPRVRLLRGIRADGSGQPEVIEFRPDSLPWRRIIAALTSVLAVLIGLANAGQWETFLKGWAAVPFQRSEPLFGHDLAFYVFTVPVLDLFRDWGMLIVFLAAAIAGAVYWVRGAADRKGGRPHLTTGATRHLSVLLALFFVVKAGDYLLQRYGLLLSDNSVVFGAAYTDVHLRLPLLGSLAALSLVAAALCFANVARAGFRLPAAAVALVFGLSLVEGLLPPLFQRYRVKPDELRLESPYITTNIALTRFGFRLDRIASKSFPAAGKLTPATLAANRVTLQNIRWWDPRPLLDTYRQLQELRLYYDFRDVDVDRYTLAGTYRQVMLSARELNLSRLPPTARTWINRHFKYTHGIGLAMSPVNRFDDEGLPEFYVKDIPPTSSVDLRLDRPRIYFGEATNGYVVVRGGTKEFDYAQGQENVYTTYDGRDGVSLGSLWRRALFAWNFGDVKLLLSSNVTGSSRVLFRRSIRERIRTLAPFLALDRDPYLVVADGRLVWMQDAYTTSNRVPYSKYNQPGGINYIRNSVKVAVDAYDGSVTFYVSDAKDPILRTYARIFPTLFKALDDMPATLRAHIRYPEDLFVVQSAMYGTYHMTDPEVFYNKEDLWSFPQESYSGETVTMQPYYTIMRLPGEAREEFILMLPMVPHNRDNMVAWLAARCDGSSYGSLIEYAFPKDKLIFGPAQIEARIDQDTNISQQLSLWNQTGSRVIRGNLLVIPIDDTVLYVEPLYLRAEQRELPEIKRVIASSGDHVAMSQHAAELFSSLFGKPEEVSPPAGVAPAPPSAPSSEALQHYRQALDALQKGDWRGFGDEMDALKKALGREER